MKKQEQPPLRSKGYWKAEMNSSKKNMKGQGETKDIIKSKVYSPLQRLDLCCHV